MLYRLLEDSQECHRSKTALTWRIDVEGKTRS